MSIGWRISTARCWGSRKSPPPGRRSIAEFLAGGGKLGVAYAGAYAMLDLPPRDPAAPVNTVLTFDVGPIENVAPLTRRAVQLGGRLVKPGFDTFFGHHRSVVKDPEGNILRLSAALSGADR